MSFNPAALVFWAICAGIGFLINGINGAVAGAVIGMIVSVIVSVWD
jgi:outer membrane lipoprotein SlyB